MFKEFFSKAYYGNTIGEWALALAIIIGSFIAAKLLYWVSSNIVRKLTEKTETQLDDILVDISEQPLVFVVIVMGFWFGLRTLTLPTKAHQLLDHVTQGLIVLAVTWWLARFVDMFFEKILMPLFQSADTDLDDQLLPIARRSIKALIWALGSIVALNNAGYDVGALIAGLGIGGLAFAMAAKDTISNVFGGATIFADKPFRLQDRVQVAGFDGYVRDIGLRSTRLETLKGRIVTIPNAKFADAPVENISMEPAHRVDLKLGLTYDTTPDQLEEAMEILRQITQDHELLEERVILSFIEFGDYALQLLCVYFIKSAHIPTTLRVKSEINLAILRAFNEAKLEFAFPTQTIYKA